MMHPACSIKEGTWLDFRESVKKVNLELFDIIEKIAPDQHYKLFEVTYLYGEKITDLGTVCLPGKDGRPLRLDDPKLPNVYREQLGYGPTPLILQLSNGSEVFVDTGERIIPLNVFTPGDFFGLFEAVIPLTESSFLPCWNVTAGARSVFMGARVSDAIGHKRLRSEYGILAEPPKRIIDQWDIIKTIANRSNSESPWSCTVLIFTKDWLEKRENDLGWIAFHNYLLVKGWMQSSHMRSKIQLSLLLEEFSAAIRNKNLKPNPYIFANIMHNLFLANSFLPGFIPADTNELLLPSKPVEYAYENVYLLKEYTPVIMHPWRLGAVNSDQPVYYSLAYPTMLEGSPAIRHAPSIISEIREVKKLMQTFEDVLRKKGRLTHNLVKWANFEYFHNEDDRFGEIQNSKELINNDSYVQACNERFKNKLFPYQGPFFRGCIRIANLLHR